MALVGEQIIERFTSLPLSTLQMLLGRVKMLPEKTVHHCVCGLLIFWLLAIVLQLLLFLFADTSLPGTAQPAASAGTSLSQKSTDINRLKAFELFGQSGANAQPLVTVAAVAQETINATKTRLNLALEGIVHTPYDEESVAVIVYQGRQDQYYVGDKLPVGSRVLLAKVMVDHVILDNAGNYESLWLYDDEKTSKVLISRNKNVPLASQSVTDKRNDNTATALAKEYRNRLYKNPSSLAEVLRISPAQRNGQMIGYRVSPGRDKQQFSQLGFKANDVVTAINGIELDEPSKALEIYKLMRTATEATFIVDRNNTSVEVVVSLNE